MRLDSPRNLIKNRKKTHAEHVAVECVSGSLTYGELASRTASLAEILQKAGIGPGIQVALSVPNSPAYLIWYFGVLEAGGIIVPLSPENTAAETARKLMDSGIRFIAVGEQNPPAPDLGMIRIDVFEGIALWENEQETAVMDTQPLSGQSILTRQFSSGSTGRPKSMLKTEFNVAHDYWHFFKTLNLGDNETFLGVAPFYHSYGAMSFLSAFYGGGRVIVLPRFFPALVVETALKYRPTVFLATPPMIEILGTCRLSEAEETAFRHLKICICSTGFLRKAAHDLFQSRFGIPVRVQYGSTETLSAAIDLDVPFEEGRVGRSYAGVTIGIFYDDGDPCAENETGNVGICSPAASIRYEDDPENSLRTFRSGYVFPGDRGYMDRTGRLYILGRSDIINIGGEKVDRMEIENVIREFLPIKEVVVIEGRRNGLPVVRAIVEGDTACITKTMVVEVCRKHLSPFKVPKEVEIRDRLDRDENGKIIRASLEK